MSDSDLTRKAYSEPASATSFTSRWSPNQLDTIKRVEFMLPKSKCAKAPQVIAAHEMRYLSLSDEVEWWLGALVKRAPKLTRRQLTREFADRLDAELKAGHWSWCNELCFALITQIEPLVRDYGNLVMTTLVYTLGAKDRIPARALLWDAVSSLMKQDGSFDEVKDILIGLK